MNNGGLSDLHPAFRQLAEATSGQAIALRDDWELEQLNTLTGGGLDGDNVVSFGSNVSNRKKRSASQASYSRYSIPVDDSMEKMVITVTTSRHNTNGNIQLCYIAECFPLRARALIGYFEVTWHVTIKLFPAKCL